MKCAVVFLCLVAYAFAADGNTCTDQSGCAATECCVHEGFGIGKRMLFEGGDPFGGDHSHGVCRARSVLNAHCIPSMLGHDLFNQKLFQSFCPCVDGLECRGESVDEGPHSISHHNPKCQASEK